MIVRTRYRDVELIDVDCCAAVPAILQRVDAWRDKRGKSILIVTPPANLEIESRCSQPRYQVVDERGNRVVGYTGRLVSVCPHIAEIGD